MTVIARKIEKSILLVLDLIFGILMMAIGTFVVPIAIAVIDIELLKDFDIWIIIICCMAFFGLIGYFCFIRHLILFKKAPKVAIETDGEYLYFYGKNEVKIPLTDMKDAYLNSEEPYALSYEFIIRLLSDKYGKIIIDVPNYGKFRYYYMADSKNVIATISDLIIKANKR